MKLVSGLIKFIILIAILSFLLKNFAAKWMLSSALGQQLGTRVKVGDVRLDFANTQFKFEDIRIYNPMEFPEGLLAEIPKLFVDWKPSSIWKGKMEFNTVELNISELNILRDAHRGLNLYQLKIFQRESSEKDGSQTQKPSSQPAVPRFLIDRFILSLGHATYTDTSGASPYQQSVHLRVDHAVYRNVDGLTGIGQIVTWESLKRMGLGGLLQAMEDIGLKDDTLESVGQFFGGLMEKVKTGLQ